MYCFVFHISILIYFILSSCSNSSKDPIEQALIFAGSNRIELENVLSHYKNEPEKKKAAEYLISNMPKWYSYSGWQLDSLQKYIIKRERGYHPSESEIQHWSSMSFYSLPKIYDSHIITAKFLIENIDLAFTVRNKYLWNKNLPFNEFCELILPYRIGDEPLSSWRKLYYNSYSSYLDSVYKGSDIIEACKLLNDTLRKRGYYWNTELKIPHQKADFLFSHRMGYCRDVCDFTIYTMRACGLPTALDFFIYSPEYQNPHYWTVLRDTTGQFIQFGLETFDASRHSSLDDGRKRGKIYRYCFGKQEDSLNKTKQNKTALPFFQNQYIKDVTHDYIKENIIQLAIDLKDDIIVYLGVFSPNGWIPIDIAYTKNNKITYKNIEPNNIYQTIINGKDGLKQIGFPFILHKDTIVHHLVPETKKMQRVTLQRKMPLLKNYRSFMHRNIIGASIEATNDLSFDDKQVLWRFNDTLTSNYNKLDLRFNKKNIDISNIIRQSIEELNLQKYSYMRNLTVQIQSP